MTPAKLQPAPGHPVWEARTDGLIYACTHPANPIVLLVWAPASEVVQPRVLAEQLRASMTFDPVSIGIVPEPGDVRLASLIGLSAGALSLSTLWWAVSAAALAAATWALITRPTGRTAYGPWLAAGWLIVITGWGP